MFSISKSALLLDTETTGLSSQSEVIELALVDFYTGDVLFDELMAPHKEPLSPIASAINGIRAEDLADKKTLYHHEKDVATLCIFADSVFCWNAPFDSRAITQTIRAHGINPLWPQQVKWVCVKRDYTQVTGRDPNADWVGLAAAAAEQGIDISDLTPHRAAADCEILRRLIHKCADWADNYQRYKVQNG